MKEPVTNGDLDEIMLEFEAKVSRVERASDRIVPHAIGFRFVPLMVAMLVIEGAIISFTCLVFVLARMDAVPRSERVEARHLHQSPRVAQGQR